MTAALPPWAAWRGGAPSSGFTVGIEEEVMLLDPHDWSLAYRSDEVMAELPRALQGHVTPETHAAVIEIATGVHERVADAVAELADLRVRLRQALAAHGLRPASAGTHPCAVWSDTILSSNPRYLGIGESMRVLARREPTLAMHVHVGMATPHLAVRAFNRLRAHLPLLLALSANSPFWQGRATGLASARTPLFDAFPRSGVPRRFHGYRDWVETVDQLVQCGAIADPSYLWWDIRLQPRFGTVELRVMDAQSTVEDAAAIAALIQALARMELEREHVAADDLDPVEIIQENHFLAARDGMEALFIDPGSPERIAAAAQFERVLAACRPHAERLGCERELASARRLATENGAVRQLAIAREAGLRQVSAELAEVYCAGAATVARA